MIGDNLIGFKMEIVICHKTNLLYHRIRPSSYQLHLEIMRVIHFEIIFYELKVRLVDIAVFHSNEMLFSTNRDS